MSEVVICFHILGLQKAENNLISIHACNVFVAHYSIANVLNQQQGVTTTGMQPRAKTVWREFIKNAENTLAISKLMPR